MLLYGRQEQKNSPAVAVLVQDEAEKSEVFETRGQGQVTRIQISPGTRKLTLEFIPEDVRRYIFPTKTKSLFLLCS